MNSKFTKEEREKFLKDLQSVGLESDSQLEDSFYERQSKRMQAEIAQIKGHKDISILEELKRNVKEEDQMITEYEKDRDQLHKITSNQTKNVIDQSLISAIKEKVAKHSNNSSMVLADEMYNQSVLTQQNQPEPTMPNASFLKVKKASEAKIQKIQEEEARIQRKIQIASQQKEHLAMEQEDKLSYKYEMQCLSDLFKERFLVPNFPKVIQRDVPIKLTFTKLPPSLVRLTPQVVSDQTVLPKNSPEIALKQLRHYKCKNLKPSSSIEVKVTPRLLQNEVEYFQQINQDKNNPERRDDKIDLMFKQYIKNIKPLVSEIEKIATEYHPRFLRYLREEQKNFNYQVQENTGGQKDINHVASLQNGNLCELKLSFEKLTSLKGIQHFRKLEQAQLQFNLLSKVDPLSNCQKLIQINLSHNKIKDISSINRLSWLKLINIEHNVIQYLKPECKSLEVLIANSNRIEQIELNHSLQLRILLLNQNRLHELPKLKLLGLEELGLASNQLKDLSGTEELILLKKLDLSHNRIQDIGQLSFLYLNELNLSGNGLTSIKDLFLPCLQEFRLNDNKLIGKGNGVAFLPNLKELNVDDNRLEGFDCIWWLLRFSKGAEVIRYGNNEYFLSLREKVREVYESMLYKEFSALKILNDAPSDRGLAQYYKENYSIYFDGSTFFQQSGTSLSKIQAIIRLLIRESTFSRNLQAKQDPFSSEQAYIDYQWKSKVTGLKRVLELSEDSSKPVIISPTLFNRYDNHQAAKRNLYHLLRGLILARKMRQQRKEKHYLKLKPTIILLLDNLYLAYLKSQKLKSINNFGILLRGLNQSQAALKIQKVWRGYIRRKIYKRLRQAKHRQSDSDDEEVDIDFFDKELEKIQFDIDLGDFDDIIIRPEVFQLLDAKNKQTALKTSQKIKKDQKKEQKNPMMNNFLDSRTKLSKEGKKEEVEGQAEKMMREWHIKDPRVLKALQYKQQKKDETRRKQLEKNMTAAQRFQKFKRGGY